MHGSGFVIARLIQAKFIKVAILQSDSFHCSVGAYKVHEAPCACNYGHQESGNIKNAKLYTLHVGMDAGLATW